MTAYKPFGNEIECKIIYYGPGLSGKTVSLEHIFSRSRRRARGRVVQLASQTKRALYFDYLPLRLARISGRPTSLLLYSVPGQRPFEDTRRLLLKEADGIVFVADSHLNRLESNFESLHELYKNLGRLGIDPQHMPMVFQYNKRDLPHATPLNRLTAVLNEWGLPEFPTVATRGEGVFDALKEIACQVVDRAAQLPPAIRGFSSTRRYLRHQVA
ncbi:MAG: gliding-motility protein MglA [Deltaproteobacteria bacterium]|nr:gliding-motility protein MglA [Deltaproteobacteria bacterium]MBW1873429.1 gliding-motility protein MglA [Deltaproteobacteria bacterium]